MVQQGMARVTKMIGCKRMIPVTLMPWRSGSGVQQTVSSKTQPNEAMIRAEKRTTGVRMLVASQEMKVISPRRTPAIQL